MIPLSAIPWRLIGYGAAVAAVGLLGWRVAVWRHSHVEALPEALAALELEQQCLEGSQCKARENALQEAVGREQVRVVTAYETELASLRDARPLSVRVCDRSRVSLPGSTSGVGAAGTPAAGVLPAEAAGDREIGPQLADLAYEADVIVARCRGLTQWTTALSAAGP